MGNGFFGLTGAEGIGANVVRPTPGRKSRLRLDVPTYVLTEPSFALFRASGEMARTNPDEQAVNVHLIEGEGWELRPKQFTTGYQHERTEGAGSNVPLTTPTGWSLLAQYRSPTDLPNATSGASAGLATSADQFLTKRVAAGDNWDSGAYRLSADQAALPEPTDDDTVRMDRIAVGTSNHDENQGFFWRIIAQGSRLTAPDKVGSTYFNGPPAVSAAFKGIGYFWLCLKGDGELWLRERVQNRSTRAYQWVVRGIYRYCDAQKACNAAHRLFIKPVTYKRLKGGMTGTIHIYAETQERSNSSSVFFAGYRRSPLQQVAVYKAFAPGDTKPPVVRQPQRLDVRRDARHKVQLTRPLYPSTGSLRCDNFAAQSFFTANQPLTVKWYGVVPSGCTITVAVYDALTDAPLSPVAAQVNITQSGEIIGGSRDFDVVYPQRQFYAIFSWTSPEDAGVGGYSTKTARLAKYIATRPGSVEDLSPEELTTRVMNFSMTGQDADPGSETGGCVVKDLEETVARLRTRGMLPFILEVKCPTDEDPDQVSHFMRGYVVSAEATRSGARIAKALGSNVQDPRMEEDWRTYDVRMAGEWTRLSAARVPFRWDLSAINDGNPPLITEVIKQAFYFAGYLDDQIDTPAVDIKLFAQNDDEQSYMLEPNADLSEFIQHMAMDYLGHWTTFDANAKKPASLVDRGLWRILPPNVPDGDGNYNVLAHFHTGMTTGALAGSGLVNPAGLAAYKKETVGDQIVQHCWVKRGTLESGVRAPECNLLCVTGTGASTFSQGVEAEKNLTVTIPNFRSFNFAGLSSGDPGYPDPDHPDYLPYIVPKLVYNSSLRSIQAVQAMARRLFERLCHGAKTLRFEAPLLLVWDSTDEKQIRPRPLRFYDAVKVDDVTWFVTSVCPSYRKDSSQWAVYTLELPNGVLF